jgi:single-strand DNA-binding protein
MAEANLHKGAEVQIEGKLVHKEYTDKTGNKKYVTEVQATELQTVVKNVSHGQ